MNRKDVHEGGCTPKLTGFSVEHRGANKRSDSQTGSCKILEN